MPSLQATVYTDAHFKCKSAEPVQGSTEGSKWASKKDMQFNVLRQ